MTEKWNTAGDAGCTHQVAGIKIEMSRHSATQTTAVNTVRIGTEGTHRSRILEYLHGANDIYTIQKIIQFAGIVVGIDRKGVARLEAGNSRDRPAPGELIQQRV